MLALLPAETARLRCVALAPGTVGGLDAQVPVLGPSPRSLAARIQLRRECRWADVIVYFGGDTALAQLRWPLRGVSTVALCTEAPSTAGQRRALERCDVVLHDGCEPPVPTSRRFFTGTDSGSAQDMTTDAVVVQWSGLLAEVA